MTMTKLKTSFTRARRGNVQPLAQLSDAELNLRGQALADLKDDICQVAYKLYGLRFKEVLSGELALYDAQIQQVLDEIERRKAVQG